MYKVELFKKIKSGSKHFKKNKLYPVRVVKRGDERVLENLNGVQVNIGWNDVYSMSLPVEREKAEFAENFKFTREIFFHNYKTYIKWCNKRKCRLVYSSHLKVVNDITHC